MIEIDNIQLLPTRNTNGLTFFASFSINHAFYVGNVAVYTRLNGGNYRCVYPVKKLPNDTEIPLCYPINKEVGEYIESEITKAADKIMADRL